jgi:hypothetical protein
VRRVVGEELGHGVPTVRVPGDEFGVDITIFDEQVQQSVEQRQVGARLDLQEQVGAFGSGGATRVDDDQLRTGLEPVGHPQIQDRMAVRHVRADDEKQIGAIEVGVRPGRAVCTE